MKKKTEAPQPLTGQDLCDAHRERLRALYGMPPPHGPRFYDPAARLVARLRDTGQLAPPPADDSPTSHQAAYRTAIENATAIFNRIPYSSTPVRELARRAQQTKTT